MAEKVLNTRIQLKYDSFTNWTTNNPVLKQGEVAIATIDTAEKNLTAASLQNTPNLMIKVGDGTNHYNDLKFLSALAADVYAWAKEAKKPVYKASEIEELDSYIAGEIQDTNTMYQIVAVEGSKYSYKLQSKELGGNWADVPGTQITLTEVDTRLTALETAIGEGGSVAGQIQAAIEALDVTDTAVEGQYVSAVSETDGKIAVTRVALPSVNDAAVEGQYVSAVKEVNGKIEVSRAALPDVAGMITTEIQKLDVADNAVTGQFVTAVAEEDGKITVSRAALADTDIPELQISKIAGLQDALDAKEDDLVFNTAYNAESNKVATMTDVTNAMAGLSGAMHFRGEVAAIPPTEGTYNSGDVVLFNDKEYVYDGTNWIELGDETRYAVKGEIKDADVAADAAIAMTKIAGLNDALAAKATPADITAAVEALDFTDAAVEHQFVTKVDEVDGKIAVTRAQAAVADIAGLQDALDAKQNNLVFGTEYNANTNKAATLADAAAAAVAEVQKLDVEDTAVEKQFVTAVSEADGKITVTRAALKATDIPNIEASQVNGLAAIATSGNVNDLNQTEGDLLVFNCGTSSVNMGTPSGT